MRYFIEQALFLVLSRFFRFFGIKTARRLAAPMAYFFFYILPVRKKTVLENLAIAFPDKSSDERYQLAFNCYKSFAVSLVEILYMPSLTPEHMKKMVDCPNKELIVKSYNEGKGVILLSAHFGNWEYVAASVSLQIGIPFSVIVKPQSNPYVNNWMNRVRTQYINKVVPLGISIRNVYKELSSKNIVAMVADQRGPAEGLRVKFFGRDSAVYSGPAMLALKTSAPIIFGVAIRQADYSYEIVLQKIDQSNLPDDEEGKVRGLSQRHISFLESIIRQHPEQWFWMHKRWKY